MRVAPLVAEALNGSPNRLNGGDTALYYRQICERSVDRLRRGDGFQRTVEIDVESRVLVPFVKELFNQYFRHDVFGHPQRSHLSILSSGSVQETFFPVPSLFKRCIEYAMTRDWYGYSDSCGRNASRKSIADLENSKIPGAGYSDANISLSLGGTSAISSLADLIVLRAKRDGLGEDVSALCAMPNYPPLVSSVQRRIPVQLVELDVGDRFVDLGPLMATVRDTTRLILLQSVINPTGTCIDERQLAALVDRAPHATILLDECHECHGFSHRRSSARSASNVVRVISVSKSLGAPGLKCGYIVGSEQLIEQFYEYASTTYGSPASLFYLAMELYGRFEHWRTRGLSELTMAEIGAIESDLTWSADFLKRLYRQYCVEMENVYRCIMDARAMAVATLDERHIDYIIPESSINLYCCPVQRGESYSAFIDLRDSAGVCVYPGILCYDLRTAWCRLSPAIAPDDLRIALARLSKTWTRAAA